jgi:vitamin B12 transporter
MIKKIVSFFLFSAMPAMLFAQYFFQDDPIVLKEVQVTSSRLEDYAVGARIESPDSALVKMHRQENLASLLVNTTGVSLKSYGAGGLSSVSMRGGLNDHTAVLWNGLNIQSPMNGGVNLSVMPVSFFSNVEVQHGGSGTLFGSGAVSGVIHLSGNDLFNQEDNVNASVTSGSFGLKGADAGFKIGNRNFATRLSVFGQTGDNDFTFSNTSRINSPEETQTNAGVKQYGVLQENQWRLSESSLITTGFWYQYYDKDLQTLMTRRKPDETNQKDENILASVNYKRYGQDGTLMVKQGMVRNRVLYSNPDLANPQADNNSYSWISEAEYKYQIGKYHSVNAGVNYTYELAKSNGYVGDATRNRLSAFAMGRYGFNSGKGAAVLSFRNEVTENNTQPLVYSFGVEHPVFNGFRLKGNVSRNYRIPNLNDLFWKEDGYAIGNPELVAEDGWSGDVGLSYSFKSGSVKTDFNTAVFASRTNDLIVWLPENGGKWKPHNKKPGETRGVEAGVKLNASGGKNHFGGQLFYTYVHSILSTEDEYNDQQMIYTPEHKLNAGLNYSRDAFYTTFAGRYTGERYYDYQSTLDAYTIVDARVGYRVSWRGFDADFSFKIKNITDVNYQVVVWYAMPPRNYRFNLNITI